MSIRRKNHREGRTQKSQRRMRPATFIILATIVAGFICALIFMPDGERARAATTTKFDLYKKPVENFDVNLTKAATVYPLASQLQALNALKSNLNDQRITARWDKKSGSVDIIYDFASAPSSLDAEGAARSFLQSNAALFGIKDMNTLVLERNTAALGGNLLYFNQVYNGIAVAGGGIGVVMDKEHRVKAVSGPYYKDLNLSIAPSLSGAAAVASAQADLAKYKIQWAAGVADVLTPALDKLSAQLGVLATPHPELDIFPTPQGARLAYKFFVFSRNPFGMYKYQIDAATGAVLYRENFVRTQQALPLTADVYPTHPDITTELKDEGKISVAPDGTPLGQLRVGLRNFDTTNAATGINGTLTGLHAHIENVLAGKLPFAQAAKGTWHFRIDDPTNFEARTNEQAHYGPTVEPAEHQDEISQFFYINSLLEYIDYIHVADDITHNHVGQGDFPDSYPNQDKPLIGNVHMPNVLDPPTDPSDPDFAEKLLGLDNAFALPVSETVAGQKVVVNPTSYGHGYLLNDTAIDFGVPYHEGMHSISSPIAGLEGAPEGSALNEGQADLWAYTASENTVLGGYVLNGYKYRQYVRDGGGNPDLRQWIRNANSGLKYSQLGSYGGSSFEEHRDGEIFVGAAWDIRQLMLMYETGGNYKRPDLITGEPSVQISLGKETWERMLLGTIYVLGTFNPDTFVRARDAMIIADASLYPSDSLDPDSPGIHRALIEQVFAAHEMGTNAAPPDGAGKQTISTKVSSFADSQEKPAAPAGVTVSLASPTSAQVSWQAVPGAYAYEILKRDIGKENQRQNAPVLGREYIDGDGGTDGYIHVEYVGGDQTSYVDNGYIEGVFIERGLKNPIGSEYVVRALSLNANKQTGVSDYSRANSVPTAELDVTDKVKVTNTAITFAPGKVDIDVTVKNLGGAGSGDGTIFTPIDVRIVSISNPSVTVANADNGGAGTSSSPADFYFRPALTSGQTSAPRRFTFNNPSNGLFTFDVVVTGRIESNLVAPTRYVPEPPPDYSKFDFKTFSETFTGIIPAGDTGVQAASGVTYVDVPFTSKDGAYAVTGRLSSTLAVDIDLELRDSTGKVLSESKSDTVNEVVTAAIQPNANYVYRVIGWAGGGDFQIESTQSLRVPKTSGQAGGATIGDLNMLKHLMRFTVNPLTKTVSVQVLR